VSQWILALIPEGSRPLAGGRIGEATTGNSSKQIEHPGRDASPVVIQRACTPAGVPYFFCTSSGGHRFAVTTG